MSYHLPKGFRFAGVSAAIKKKTGTKDIALIVSDVPAVAAGVYTQNQVVAAPVVLCRARTPMSVARAVVVNSGNANACTGSRGDADARRMCELVAQTLSASAAGGTDAAPVEITAEQALVMSTGVIGHFLPMDKVEAGIRQAAGELAAGEAAFLNAADGIMTTDVARKVTTRQAELGGRVIGIAGMAKGACLLYTSPSPRD